MGCGEGNPRARVELFSLPCSRHPAAHVVVGMARAKKLPFGTEEDQKVGLYAEGWRERDKKRRIVPAIIIEIKS